MPKPEKPLPERPEGTLPSDLKLEIRDEVERCLKNLPADTYKLIEEMVSYRVEQREKWYRWVGVIVGIAITVVAVSFFKITASNAAEKVTSMLEKSEVAKKIEGINNLHRDAQDKLHTIVVTANEITNRSAQLTARLKELEKIDNIVRYAADGTLLVKSVDGAIWFQRRDESQPKGYFRFQIENGQIIATEFGQ